MALSLTRSFFGLAQANFPPDNYRGLKINKLKWKQVISLIFEFWFLILIQKSKIFQSKIIKRITHFSHPFSEGWLQKGGVPAAPSGTATLLRLSPSYRFYPRRRLATIDFRHSRFPWLDGRCVQGPGTYSPRHCWYAITSESNFKRSNCRPLSELRPTLEISILLPSSCPLYRPL